MKSRELPRIGPAVRPYAPGEPCAMGREWTGPGIVACPEPAEGQVMFNDRPGEIWPLCGTHSIALAKVALADAAAPPLVRWWRHARARVARWRRLAAARWRGSAS